jgi:hypothetical protein
MTSSRGESRDDPQRGREMMIVGDPGTVSLFYSLDSGQNWRIIALGEPDDSSYVWTTPSSESDSCRVAIQAVDLAGNHGSGMSEADFVLTSGLSMRAKGRSDEVMSRLLRNGIKEETVRRRGVFEGELAQTVLASDVRSRAGILPLEFDLSQNSPNPFNPATSISFTIAGDDPVETELIVYDLRGRKITTLLSESYLPGQYTVHWDGRDMEGRPVASGVYVYTLKAGENVLSRKMTLLR